MRDLTARFPDALVIFGPESGEFAICTCGEAPPNHVSDVLRDPNCPVHRYIDPDAANPDPPDIGGPDL